MVAERQRTRIGDRPRLFLLGTLCCLCMAACSPDIGKGAIARDGLLTLDAARLSQPGGAALSGQWRVYWNRLLAPDVLAAGGPIVPPPQPKADGLMVLPGLWQGLDFGNGPVGRYGHATLALDLDLRGNSRDMLAFRARDAAQAFVLFADGKAVLRSGRVGLDRAGERPSWTPQIGLFLPRDARVRLVLHVSNYHHRLGGVWSALEVGTVAAISTKREVALALDVAMFAAALILAIYHLFLFLMRPQERAALLFALFCFCFAIRVAVTGEMFLLQLFPGISWEVAVRTEYLSYYLAVPTFAWFMQLVFAADFLVSVRKVLLALGLLFSALVVITEPRVFSHSLLAYHSLTVLASCYALFVLVRLICRGRAGALGFLLSFLVLFGAALHDILSPGSLMATAYLAPLGGIFFVGFQAVLLSRRLTGALTDLQVLSETLEEQVRSRTDELASSVERAVASERVARTLHAEAEGSRIELEKLTEIARSITSATDLRSIMDLVSAHLEQHFAIEGTMLQLVDAERSSLRHFATNFKSFHGEEVRSFVEGFTLGLSPMRGTVASIINRRKPAYFPRFARRLLSEVDPLLELVRGASISSALIVPLFVREQLVGMLYFSSYSQRLKLSRADIATISRFCDQITGAVQASSLLQRAQEERTKSERLLLNILPEQVAAELKERGQVSPVSFESVSILFTDFKGFTSSASTMEPRLLVEELDRIFEQFDSIMDTYRLEKLKTIGDAYMAAGGLPVTNRTHPVDVCLAALEMQALVERIRQMRTQAGAPDFWELRIGVHTGPVVAGVIGKNKFAYDVWGDTVNVAARMETASEPGRVNISRATRDLVADFFDCQYRGKIEAKNRGSLEMYFVTGLHPHLRRGTEQRVPGPAFEALYQDLAAGGG